MIFKSQLLSNFSRFPAFNCQVARPQRYDELFNIPNTCTIRGQGLSYSDAAILPEAVIETERLNRFLSFDKKLGRLKVEAGIRIRDILPIIIPAGWFLPVTPGTDYVSIGGCIACNVHGKNHAKKGNFGQHVISFTLITANKETLQCSLTQNAEIFNATLGGMGLTGLIAEVELQLIPIETNYLNVKTDIVNNLSSLLTRLSTLAQEEDYAIAWVNSSSNFKQETKGVITSAHHVKITELPSQQQSAALRYSSIKEWSIPKIALPKILTPFLIKIFNGIHQFLSDKKTSGLQNLQSFFYPLTKLKNWNHALGKKGFIQYQCYIPTVHGEIGIQQLLEYLQTSGLNIPLITIKYFGDDTDPSGLTFSGTGYTIAIDLIIDDETIWGALQKLDEIVIQRQGKVYLAKDVRLNPHLFRTMYPGYSNWLIQKKAIDPNCNFTSSMAKRLQIGE